MRRLFDKFRSACRTLQGTEIVAALLGGGLVCGMVENFLHGVQNPVGGVIGNGRSCVNFTHPSCHRLLLFGLRIENHGGCHV